MGAWGHGPFDNDDAADWVSQLEESTGLSVVQSALDGIAGSGGGYLEAPACSEALAAAEVVAALRGRPAAILPEEVRAWAKGRASAPVDLVEHARKVVRSIRSKSELRDLWEESEQFDAWSKVLDDLEARLAG